MILNLMWLIFMTVTSCQQGVNCGGKGHYKSEFFCSLHVLSLRWVPDSKTHFHLKQNVVFFNKDTSFN